MTPQEFAKKWMASTLGERSAAHQHFIDLCHILREPTPSEEDLDGSTYCFEKGARKIGGGKGWADVWRRHKFAWEYKGKHKNLDVAFAQLQRYALVLENPPLLVVSDMERIKIHTNFTNTVHREYEIPISELHVGGNLQTLKYAFTEPDRLRPGQTKTAITEQAAKRFADLAEALRGRGAEPERVAHFLNRILFCLFAQDAGLLPTQVVLRVLESGLKRPDQADRMLRELFRAMKDGGPFGADVIEWFNGGLFESDDAIPVEPRDIKELLAVATLDWNAIEPSIFGTLFERGMDPGKRSQIGAHYTDPQSIMRIVRPAVIEPLSAEWDKAKREISAVLEKSDKGRDRSARKRAYNQAQRTFDAFLDRLAKYTVLDPACGSGNFLYIALQELKNLEHRASLEAEQLGLQAPLAGMHVGVHCLRGIEANGYAAELARVTVWIGEIQWMLRHGMPPSKNPILKSLKTIEQRDAVLLNNASEPEWPDVDAIIGNPPFLGDKKMRRQLGGQYVDALRGCYEGRVPGGADLVTYWFEKARAQIEARKAAVAGLVATNSIRGGANRKVLDRIATTTRIFEAWSDEEWVNEGADVRVSLVCFGNRVPGKLDNKAVTGINSDLTPAGVDVTTARRLTENVQCCFYATVKAGSFDIDGETARKWLALPNPHGKPNRDVVKPWANARDVTRRSSDKWVVDFGVDMPLREAALYQAPFEHVRKQVKPERDKTRRAKYRKVWWLFAEPIPGMRAALKNLARYIATPAVSKHRLFVWMPKAVVADHALMVIARDDETTFGILQSRFHELWALRLCTWVGVGNDPRYTPTTTFETFPFPAGLTPRDSANRKLTGLHAVAIAKAARRLTELRDRWLNPPEWVESKSDMFSELPLRLIPRKGHEADVRRRTLTALYNERPAWLDEAHRALDSAVAEAYGWNDYTPGMPEEEIMRRLLRLNVERAPDLFSTALEGRQNAIQLVKPGSVPKRAIRIADRIRKPGRGKQAA